MIASIILIVLSMLIDSSSLYRLIIARDLFLIHACRDVGRHRLEPDPSAQKNQEHRGGNYTNRERAPHAYPLKWRQRDFAALFGKDFLWFDNF
jgi:hypothetical protein